MRKRFFLLGTIFLTSLMCACANDSTKNVTSIESTSILTSDVTENLTQEVMTTATPETTTAPIQEQTTTEKPHEHLYEEKVTLKETCDKEGEKTFLCACGDTYTEVIPACGHAYVADEASKQEATCEKEGKEADKKCSVCGDTIKGESISKANHIYGEYVYNNDATQDKDGTKSRSCTVCEKVDTKTAEGTKLPFDPKSLRGITSLDEIYDAGTLTNEDTSILTEIGKNTEAGKYEKVRYIASDGQEFCLWNVRVKETRTEYPFYYWFIAPVEGKFSDGSIAAKFGANSASEADRYIIARGTMTSCRENECMINRDTSIPLAYREINSSECPVKLYEIVETDKMISVWVESTNCIQSGIGTCGSIDCTGTCLRQTTLDKLKELMMEKANGFWIYGENGRINWNGKLLVNFFYILD